MVREMLANPLNVGNGLTQAPLRQGNQDHTFAGIYHIFSAKNASALFRPALAEGQQARQAFIGSPVAWQGDPVNRAILQNQTAAGNELWQRYNVWLGNRRVMADLLPRRGIHPLLRPDFDHLLCLVPKFLQGGPGTHDPRKRIVVCDGDGRQSEFCGAHNQFFGVRCPGQEGEVGRDAQLGIVLSPHSGVLHIQTKVFDRVLGVVNLDHANSPCTNQAGFCGV